MEHETYNLLTAVQAAERIGVSRIAVYQAIKEGRLACVQIGNTKLLRLADVDEYANHAGKRNGHLTKAMQQATIGDAEAAG